MGSVEKDGFAGEVGSKGKDESGWVWDEVAVDVVLDWIGSG